MSWGGFDNLLSAICLSTLYIPLGAYGLRGHYITIVFIYKAITFLHRIVT